MDYVLVLARSTATGDNIFVIKDRPPAQLGRINLPGGKCEVGETAAETAVREFGEETGIRFAGAVAPLGAIQGAWGTIACFRFDLPDDVEIRPQEGETEEFFWMNWDGVRDDPRLMPNLRLVVPMMNCGVKDWTVVDNAAGPNNRPYTVGVTFR